jgi:hypothetical protein
MLGNFHNLSGRFGEGGRETEYYTIRKKFVIPIGNRTKIL